MDILAVVRFEIYCYFLLAGITGDGLGWGSVGNCNASGR